MKPIIALEDNSCERSYFRNMAPEINIPELLNKLSAGHIPSLARAISIVENRIEGYETIMLSLNIKQQPPITGITGAPGAGKSTLVDALIAKIIQQGKKLAVVCIDPSSPFNTGSLLGDRIRMSSWHNHSQVYIRSLSTRGSLGGLNPMVYEITEILKAAGFDHILIETVGVGQTEVEISALADTTVVVLVPEGGDDIQAMKSGLMEVGDIFVINKADRPEAGLFYKHISQMLLPVFRNEKKEIPVIKTVATTGEGIDTLSDFILKRNLEETSDKKFKLLTKRAWNQIMLLKMKDVKSSDIEKNIRERYSPEFNLYKFSTEYNKTI